MASSAPDLLSSIADSVDEEREFLESALGNCPADDAKRLAKLDELGVLPLQRGYQIWAKQLGLAYHSLENLDIRYRHRLPLDIALRHGAIVVDESDGVLSVALRNPFELVAVDEIQEATKMSVEVVLSPPGAIQKHIERLERGSFGIEGLIQKLSSAKIDGQGLDAEQLRNLGGDDAVIKLVDHLIEEAIGARSSDIHIEPQRDFLRVRIRVDGSLDTLYNLPPGLHRAVVARIKVASGMDVGESRKPQDGRISVTDVLELRVSVLPSVLGEKAVMRVLDRSGLTLDPEALGMTDANHKMFRRGYSAPNGIVLLTGPTGSGKTTTLYTAMSELNRPETNIVTVEDPVEYELAGTTQVQVDIKAERTFANALRAILRQDPDVVMVGEIRDVETATIAVQAALTGHMVLSTVHSNDALSTVHRLYDMGIPPYLLGPALRCVVGQRLVPKVCTECSEPHVPAPTLLAEFGVSPGDTVSLSGLRRGAGCQACRGRGKRGRIAIHEVLHVNTEFAEMISRGAREEELRPLATRAGYETLMRDGLRKAQKGLIMLEDVLTVARVE